MVTAPTRPSTLTHDRRMRILGAAAGIFHVTPLDILGRDRHKTVSLARHVAAYLFRNERLSYPEIGREMGLDHTSVLSAVRRVTKMIDGGDPDCYEIVARIHAATAYLNETRWATP